MTKLMNAFLPLKPLIADAITFIIIETVRISIASFLCFMCVSIVNI